MRSELDGVRAVAYKDRTMQFNDFNRNDLGLLLLDLLLSRAGEA